MNNTDKSHGETLMDTIIPKSVIIKQNVLETDSIQELFTKIINKELSFSDLLEIINMSSTKLLRDKLISLFILLDSQSKLDINEYLEKSKDPNRNIRQVIVLCILEKIKFLNIKIDVNYKTLFDNIYPERLMDVDSFIRFACLETFGLLCSKDEKILMKNFVFLKYGLNDKNEIIRKCSLKIIIENFEAKKSTKHIFLQVHKRINEILEFDKCKIVRNLATKAVFLFYKAEFIGDAEVLKALNINLYLKTYRNFLIGFFNDNSTDGFLNELDFNASSIKEFNVEDFKTYEKFAFHQDSLYIPLTLHFISDKLNNQVINLSTTELGIFLNFVYWKESHNFKCCEKENCYLEVLKIIPIPEALMADFCKLQEVIKQNKKYLEIYAEIFKNVDLNILMCQPSSVERAIKLFGEQKISCLEFFKKINNSFKTAVSNALMNYSIKEKMKYFDFSDELKEKDDILTKSYAVFWILIRHEFSKINNISLTKLVSTEIPEFLEILDFFQKKAMEFSNNHETNEPNDLISGIKVFYQKLKNFLETNLDLFFGKESNAILLIEYLNRKGINDFNLGRLFFIQSSKNINVILKLKPKQLIFDILFGKTMKFEDVNIETVVEKLKILIPNVKRGSVHLFLYFNEFCLIERFEKILIELVPLLKLEDAIVLENKSQGKIRDVLSMKIKREDKK
ncbi:hypothetical protein CDIK_1634 [Cucumispora dikerogammari]|nr:hypothetical protein CDIK_1634 [Cucumispora dikerogammari]